MEPAPHHEDIYPTGEDSGTDMRMPFARQTNRILRNVGNENTFIDLGGELGEVPTNHIRFRDAVEEGHLMAYVRQESSGRRVIIPTVIALGIVAAGVYGLKHRKQSKG